jgi:hypothetical protein
MRTLRPRRGRLVEGEEDEVEVGEEDERARNSSPQSSSSSSRGHAS